MKKSAPEKKVDLLLDAVAKFADAARRAQLLALETYPGCNAHTLGVLIEETWRCPAQDGGNGAMNTKG